MLFPIDVQQSSLLYPAPEVIEWRRSFQGSLTGEAVVQYSIKSSFDAYAELWRKTRGITSSPSQLTNNRYYLKIIDLGSPVIPFLLSELRTSPDYWFVALRKLTNEDPVSEEHRGDLDAMAGDWLTWARSHNIAF